MIYPISNKHIFLIGPRGSGKSSVGSALATGLGMVFLDADTYLQEKHNRSVSDIFKTEGESGFRVLESTAMEEICMMKPKVIATGGGAVLSERNRMLMAKNGLCVWLKTSEDTLLERLWSDRCKGVDRPALISTSEADPKNALRREIHEVMLVREPLYQSTANWIQETDHKPPEIIVQEIIHHLSGLK